MRAACGAAAAAAEGIHATVLPLYPSQHLPRALVSQPAIQNSGAVPLPSFLSVGHMLRNALFCLKALQLKAPALFHVKRNRSGLPDSLGAATDTQFRLFNTMFNTDRCDNNDQRTSAKRKTPNGSCELSDMLPIAVELPSALRSLLATLLLTSKFTQDKRYSNCTPARFSGLSPREIGRCERTLGEALQQRLWVGKLPQTSSPVPSTDAVVCPSLRAWSDSCLKPTEPFFAQSGPVPQAKRSPCRCSTLPVKASATDDNRARPVFPPLPSLAV